MSQSAASARPATSLANIEPVAHWLRERCGFSFADTKLEMLAQRLARVLERFELPDFAALASELARGAGPDLLNAVVGAAATHHTYFFREESALAFFRDDILRPRGTEPTRIWSAAASTGDEAYTCAIIAAETLGRHEAVRAVSLLATDISADVIRCAEVAEFSKSHLEPVGPAMLARYFDDLRDGRWRVAPDIRAMCLFRRLNLVAAPYPFRQRFHAVFCRNVLYYFDLETQRAVVEAIYEATEPGGYLLVSAADSLRGLNTRWTPVHSSVYRRLAT